MSNINSYNFQINLSNNKNLNNLTKLLPILYISDKLKKSLKEELILRDGLKLVINEYKPKRSVNISFEIVNAPIEIAFCMAGRMMIEFETKEGYKDTLEVSKGSAALFFLPNTNGNLKIYPNETLIIISLHCSPKFISQFIDGGNIQLSNNKLEIINNEINKAFIELTKSTNWMVNLINQIYECKFSGASKKMFLEAKAVELITIMFEHLKAQFIDEESFVLSKFDMIKIETVDYILKKDLVNVPTLLELARISGMSHTKLNKSFKKVYGNTVFNYLRELRLDEAKRLLLEDKFSITEIAFETGWSSPSHLIKEFTNKFYLTPKAYFKEMSKL